jgi:hypothetical protein
MRPILLIGTLFVIIILIAAVWWTTRVTYVPENSTSYINGVVMPGENSVDGNVVYLGDFTTQSACQDATTTKGGLTGYTWHDGSNGPYANQCYGVQTIKQRDAQVAHQSAYVK